MASRVFISFAVEDTSARDLLIGQARNARCPFELIDYSLREPFSERWKTQCRARIGSCSAFIALLSWHTLNAEGARWEMRCAGEEGLPRLGVQIHANLPAPAPQELWGVPVINWTWDGIAAFLNGSIWRGWSG